MIKRIARLSRRTGLPGVQILRTKAERDVGVCRMHRRITFRRDQRAARASFGPLSTILADARRLGSINNPVPMRGIKSIFGAAARARAMPAGCRVILLPATGRHWQGRLPACHSSVPDAPHCGFFAQGPMLRAVSRRKPAASPGDKSVRPDPDSNGVASSGHAANCGTYDTLRVNFAEKRLPGLFFLKPAF
jgi:hypothetical protein